MATLSKIPLHTFNFFSQMASTLFFQPLSPAHSILIISLTLSVTLKRAVLSLAICLFQGLKQCLGIPILQENQVRPKKLQSRSMLLPEVCGVQTPASVTQTHTRSFSKAGLHCDHARDCLKRRFLSISEMEPWNNKEELHR